MGRHWFILNSGEYPSISAETPFTIDLQAAGLEPADLREQVISFDELTDLGVRYEAEHPGEFERLAELARPDDLAILVLRWNGPSGR